jgi:D-alanyl-D-alanine carboxypeptidase
MTMRVRVSHLVLLVLISCSIGLAGPAMAQGIPNSPTGKVAKALAKFTATSGDDALKAFLDERVTQSARKEGSVAKNLVALREQCPTAQIGGARKNGEWEATIQFSSPSGSCRVSYIIDSKSPHSVQSLELEANDHGSAAQGRTGGGDAGSSVGGNRGRLMERFIEAFNSGDAQRMLAFYSDGATADFKGRRNATEDRELYERIWNELGRLESLKMTVEGDDKVRLTAESGNMGGTVALIMNVVAGPPPLIDGFSIEVGGPPGGGDNPLPHLSVPPSADRAQTVAAVDRYLQGLAADGVFSGAVLISRGDDVAFEGQYGMANREDRIPITAETRFDIGSITKNLTKTAIGQLARDGKLSLDDQLIDHVPDYPNRKIAKKITIGQLLTHSSGLGDIFNERFEKMPKEKLLSPRDFFPIFADEPLGFVPGEGRQYSNAGYVVLGVVIEGASGMAYSDYLQKYIFEPAGMQQSGFPLRDGSRPELAIGYTSEGSSSGRSQRNIGMLPIRGCPAGSSSHTAADLLRFDRAVRKGMLLGPGWTDWYFTGSVPSAAALERPMGLIGQGIGVAGGGPGVNAILDSDERGAIIVLANLDPPIAGHLAARLRDVSID